MSDTEQGPGWWQASDGKWYPPESHPNYSSPQSSTPPRDLPTPAPVQSQSAQTAATPPGEQKKPLWKRWWFLLIVAVVVIGIIAVVAAPADDEAPAASGGDSVEPTAAPSGDSVEPTAAPSGDSVESTAAPSGDSVESTEAPSDEGATTSAPVVTEAPTEATPLPPGANPALAVVGVETLPAGEPGQLSVVAQASALDRSGSLPIVVRNLTDKPVADIEVTGTARDASGALVGSGSDQGLNPFMVGPGEIAIGYVYFGMDELPAGTTFELSVIGTDPDDLFLGGLDLVVVEHNRTADSIVVMLRNDTDTEASGPIGLILMCFDEAAVPTETRSTFAEQDVAPPGATVSATFSFFGDPPCERYILGGSGYNF